LGAAGTTDAAIATPTAVVGGLSFASISAGAFHTCAMAGAPAAVYCFGDNTAGQLGSDIDGGATSTPTRIVMPAGQPQVDSIEVGAATSCGRAAPPSGALACWGANNHGQLGVGTKDNDPHNHILKVVGIGPIKGGRGAFSVGLEHVCAIAQPAAGAPMGDVYCWGSGSFGKLGVDATATDDSPTPKPVILPE
jgi:alpha-tubulin suppressor-like RCC1 family protein